MKIEHVDLVHFCHSDYGFTDHPTVCRELQRRYIDIAVDAVLATTEGPEEGRFCWTAEATLAVDDWWRGATRARRKKFLQAVASGQLDITALPLNQTPTLNRRQWQKLLHWLPDDLWQQIQPQSAVQNDVNGMPRAGAVALLDRDVRYLFTGINSESGGPPMSRPSALWWKMPDGRRMFVWLNDPYPDGYSYFEPISWRRGPVPEAFDTRYRPPRPGEILPADEASVRKAHGHLIERLGKLEAAGYPHATLLISMTNEWRIDGDPPFPPLAQFVAAWHRLGLRPTLRLTTVSTALKRLEAEIGGRIAEYEGEWTDWWANGVASGPREVSASRFAKRVAAAAESPVWGPLDANGRNAIEEIYEQLCLFDEHTWGHINSVAMPCSLEVIGQYNEKSRLAYRPLAQAQLLLSQRIRRRLAGAKEGFYVTNTSKLPWSGWVTMLASCLRDDYRSVEDPASGVRTPIELRNGLRPYERPQNPSELTIENTAETFPDNCPGMAARFWVEGLQGGETRRLRLSIEPAEDLPSPIGRGAGGEGGVANSPHDALTLTLSQRERGPISTLSQAIELDEHQWPTAVTWPGMERPLFLPGFGDFLSVGVRGFAARWINREVFAIEDDAERQRRRREVLEEILAVPAGPATVEHNGPTTVYTQVLHHPRLQWATRRLELWNREPRARLTLRLNRISWEAPEVLFVTFALPCEGVLPRTSNGGMGFVPYEDQLPGSCRDYFGIDGWVHYQTPQGNWIWVSRDAPLVTFGGQQVLARRKDAPEETHRVLAMIFDNRWFTNFVADSHGAMEFQFDLAWKPAGEPISAEELAESLVGEPQVIITPSWKDDPVVARYLCRP
jgi:hypothetical protein